MNAQQLSNRLKRVADYVPKGAVVADIGSDHAYLPCYLVLNGIARKAIAGEVVQGPYDSARNQVMQEQLTKQIEVRLASGLGAVQAEDGVTVVTIAGMGGPLIRTILEQGKERLTGVERLVLQPNVHAQSIREWAVANNWSVIDEEILKENDKIYEILVLEQTGRAEKFSPEELLLGPVLMKEQSEVFKEKWTKEHLQWSKIVSSMESAEETAELANKKQELLQKIKLVEEVLNNENS